MRLLAKIAVWIIILYAVNGWAHAIGIGGGWNVVLALFCACVSWMIMNEFLRPLETFEVEDLDDEEDDDLFGPPLSKPDPHSRDWYV